MTALEGDKHSMVCIYVVYNSGTRWCALHQSPNKMCSLFACLDFTIACDPGIGIYIVISLSFELFA